MGMRGQRMESNARAKKLTPSAGIYRKVNTESWAALILQYHLSIQLMPTPTPDIANRTAGDRAIQ